GGGWLEKKTVFKSRPADELLAALRPKPARPAKSIPRERTDSAFRAPLDQVERNYPPDDSGNGRHRDQGFGAMPRRSLRAVSREVRILSLTPRHILLFGAR